jgi:hypothetical protein
MIGGVEHSGVGYERIRKWGRAHHSAATRDSGGWGLPAPTLPVVSGSRPSRRYRRRPFRLRHAEFRLEPGRTQAPAAWRPLQSGGGGGRATSPCKKSGGWAFALKAAACSVR